MGYVQYWTYFILNFDLDYNIILTSKLYRLNNVIWLSNCYSIYFHL